MALINNLTSSLFEVNPMQGDCRSSDEPKITNTAETALREAKDLNSGTLELHFVVQQAFFRENGFLSSVHFFRVEHLLLLRVLRSVDEAVQALSQAG